MLTIKTNKEKGPIGPLSTSFLINGQDVGQYIMSVDVSFRPDSIVTANVEICARMGMNGIDIENLYMPHPVSGKVGRVKKIVFDDGNKWESK